MSISKIFIPNFVCVLTNVRYKTYQTGFSLSPGSCPRGGTLGYWGCPGYIFFFKHGHVAYQINGDDEQNKMQVKEPVHSVNMSILIRLISNLSGLKVIKLFSCSFQLSMKF